jgi:hypothetical protein
MDMQNLIIVKSLNTPSIEFLTNGILRISGRSVPENPVEFFKDVFTWLNEYQNSDLKKTEFHIDLEYYNSSSSIVLLHILRKLKHCLRLGFDVQVHWHNSFNDEEMIESGRYYEKIVKIPFHYHELN